MADLRIRRESIALLGAPVMQAVKKPEQPKGPPPSRGCPDA
jgi:hypothetical protein